MMAKGNRQDFGQVIRARRRQLGLTQQEIGRRIKTSTPYVGHLEAGKRHPSDKVLSRLAQVLGLDRSELFFLANPQTAELLKLNKSRGEKSAWEEFREDGRTHRAHGITSDEIELLSKVDRMGDVRSSRDFIYILKAIRHALRR
jgi:transcriptional regulator with XRE-family HTH domain